MRNISSGLLIYKRHSTCIIVVTGAFIHAIDGQKGERVRYITCGGSDDFSTSYLFGIASMETLAIQSAINYAKQGR